MQPIRWLGSGEYRHALHPGRTTDEALRVVAAFLAERGDVEMNDGCVVFRHPRRRYWYLANPFDLTGITRAELRGGEDGSSLRSEIETRRPLWVAAGAFLLWGVAVVGIMSDTGELEQVILGAAWLFMIVPFSAVVFRGLVGLAWRAAVAEALRN